MNKIKILVIAPYNGMKDLICEIAEDMKELEVHAFVGDMLDGVKIAEEKKYEDFDVIISRAGTAELIKEITHLPVIDIKLSAIDMMRAIKLAKSYSGKFGIVGFKSITDTTKVISQLNHGEHLEIKTVHSISEIDDCLHELIERGISLIIGDVITVKHAKKMGLNTILVTSGRESVITAFTDIIQLFKHISTFKEKILLTHNIIRNVNDHIIAFNGKKDIAFSNVDEPKEIKEMIISEAEKHVDMLTQEKKVTIMKPLGSELYLFHGKMISSNGLSYPTFYINKQKSKIKPVDKSVIYTNVSDEPTILLDSLPTSNKLFKKVIQDAKTVSKTNMPIILFGKKGTGKDTFAKAIYHGSNYQKQPMIIIDAHYMNEKKWSAIFESENSPFLNENFTFYFKNMHLLNEDSQLLLESYLTNTYVHKRNRFIFSCMSGYSHSFDQGSLMQFIQNELSAFPLTLPALNERKEDIPSLVSIFLSDLMPKYGKQILGLEPEAIHLLQHFHWTYNLIQLKRIIEKAFLLTDDFYIADETIEKVLANEKIEETEIINPVLHGHKTLDEINKEIIEKVLSDENYNQSRAAQRLGISRSTLWRKLKY
ncbi:PrpR N-terminal domain-containing protein [Siminovitchia sp. FSL H7-0308]|uniref:sigma-54-dependent Fis family transcriptional regulator n=1 Tax=Siminovitchia sp. FSL H7-0308 TaxID=2921432 RepID=UPI0030EEF332